uniref:Uncharacterized protein n=1 Tax=Knipowitschia caucasica TaxID=637954 RepID=A0AAV2KXE1_KNICA
MDHRGISRATATKEEEEEAREEWIKNPPREALNEGPHHKRSIEPGAMLTAPGSTVTSEAGKEVVQLSEKSWPVLWSVLSSDSVSTSEQNMCLSQQR